MTLITLNINKILRIYKERVGRAMFLNHFTIDDNINCQKKSGSLYQIRRMYPRDNHHYKKNIKLIGGVDLNPERFDSEY
jgi:hypothetical protein